MVDDLLKTHTLVGISYFDLMKILGPPDPGYNPSRINFEVAYSLGWQINYPAKSIFFPGRFQNFEAWRLRVLVENEKVIKVWVDFF
jgi:hypothetical protein